MYPHQSTKQSIFSTTTIKDVISSSSIQKVLAVIAKQAIVSFHTEKPVFPLKAVNRFSLFRPSQYVLSSGAININTDLILIAPASFSASADTVRKVLTKLYSQANRIQVTRRKQPLDGPGRRGFEYGIE